MSEQRENRKIALVTGANKGIGRAIAERLGGLGITVYVGARDPAKGDRAANEIAAAGADARFLHLDVTDQTSAMTAAGTIESDAGRLDILVNDAGINVRPTPKPSETPVDDLRRTYETNVFGVVTVTNAMLPLLRRSPAARIVNLSSDLGSLHHAAANDHPAGEFPLLLAYNSSKSALNAITIAYANELRHNRVLVNAVSPGYVATDLNDFQGVLTPEQGARLPVLMATIEGDGPTATFRVEDGSPEGRILPW
jgi:NAD(P)-dependent dehydrogenase (short-subunit alcohol dehydrogenase family)